MSSDSLSLSSFLSQQKEESAPKPTFRSQKVISSIASELSNAYDLTLYYLGLSFQAVSSIEI